MYIALCKKHVEQLSEGLEKIFENTWSHESCYVKGCDEVWSISYKGKISEEVLSKFHCDVVMPERFKVVEGNNPLSEEYSFMENSNG